MTASQQAKAAGLRSLTQMIELTGVPRQTLIDWHRNKPERFEKILKLCADSIELAKWNGHA